MEKYRKKSYELNFEIVEPGTEVYNFLEDTHYVTDEERNIVLTGLKGEQWPISKEEFNKKYYITSDGVAKTKPAQNTIFAEECKVPQEIKTSWGDTLKAEKGSYIVYNNKDGEPDKNDKWVIDKDVFKDTYQNVNEHNYYEKDRYVNEHLDYYKKSGKFNAIQLKEIRDGLKNGVDVTKYAQPNLHYNEMRLIREGLEKGIDASIYLDAGFTDGQLREILNGAAEGFDVSTYANLKYDEKIMFLARRGFEKGITDLPEYFDKGYNYNQIEFIYCGKKNGLDTSFYENPELDQDQMNAIMWGVKYGVDATKFNDPKMSADEMMKVRDELIKEKEIGLWEKEGFDVAPYVNKLDCFQLEEIRLGLEKNLDVSAYAKAEYDFEQMEAIREALEDGIDDMAEFINYGPAYSDVELIDKYTELSKLADGNFSFEDISKDLKPSDDFKAIYDYFDDVEKEIKDSCYEY